MQRFEAIREQELKQATFRERMDEVLDAAADAAEEMAKKQRKNPKKNPKKKSTTNDISHSGLVPSARRMHFAGTPPHTSPAGISVHFGNTARLAMTAPSPIVQPG